MGEATKVDPNDPKGKQQAIHKAESFSDYLKRRQAEGGGRSGAPTMMAVAGDEKQHLADHEMRDALLDHADRVGRAGVLTMSEIHSGPGKGFGGGEATRDPEATKVDPNDP